MVKQKNCFVISVENMLSSRWDVCYNRLYSSSIIGILKLILVFLLYTYSGVYTYRSHRYETYNLSPDLISGESFILDWIPFDIIKVWYLMRWGLERIRNNLNYKVFCRDLQCRSWGKHFTNFYFNYKVTR